MQNYNRFYFSKILNQIIGLIKTTFPITFWVLLLFAFDKEYLAILTIICAVIHELGHLFFAVINTRFLKLKGTADGFRIKISSHSSYMDELIITIGGPLANFTVFLMLCIFKCNYLYEFATLNLFTALSNLLLIDGYDGYKIVNCALMLSEFPHTKAILNAISLATSILLCFTSLYLILRVDSGYWIYFIFLFAIIKKIQSDQRLLFARKNEISRDYERFREVYQGEIQVKCE